MERFSLSLLIFLLAALGSGFAEGPRAASAQQQSQHKEQDVRFRWAFGALVRAQKGPEFVAVKRDTTLKTGDQFKMFLELQKNCFVYVIYHGTQGEVYLLFPYNLKHFDTNYQTFREYYIPQGDGWFELDEHAGRETFYLLASVQRLHALEALTKDYASVEPEKKRELAEQILAEIRRLRWRHREFKTFAEPPEQIVGRVRGVCGARKAVRPDISSIAIEVCAKTFYGKTFTIDHQ